MKKIVRFKELTTVIPIDNEKTKEEVEDELIEALENIGSRFTSYKVEIEDEEDE